MARMNPETAFQNKVINYFKEEKRGYWIKIHVSSYQSKGEPDIIGCYRGFFVAIELKRPDGKGKVAKLQEVKLRRIKENGGFGIVAKDLEEVKDILKKVDHRIDVILRAVRALNKSEA
jgi:hypothetical protein